MSEANAVTLEVKETSGDVSPSKTAKNDKAKAEKAKAEKVEKANAKKIEKAEFSKTMLAKALAPTSCKTGANKRLRAVV